MLFNSSTMINVTSSPYNAVGNGSTDNTTALNAAYTDALAAGKGLYFPAGNFYTLYDLGFAGVAVFGASPLTSIISGGSDGTQAISCNYTQDMGFYNRRIADYIFMTQNYFYPNVTYINCNFTSTVLNSSYYWCYLGFYTYQLNILFDECKFNFKQIYVGIEARLYNSITVRNCSFIGGYASGHVIRVREPGNPNASENVTISNNLIDCSAAVSSTIINGIGYNQCTTGIDIYGQRYSTISPKIEKNTVIGIREEAIGYDGVGNSAVLCPTICNGTFTALSNDAQARLVVGLTSMVYNNGSATVPMVVSNSGFVSGIDTLGFPFNQGSGYTPGTYTNVPLVGSLGGSGATMNLTIYGTGVVGLVYITISAQGANYQYGETVTAPSLPGGSGFSATVFHTNAAWTNFHFSMGAGSNFEGSLFKIVAFDTANNTLTLDSLIPYTSIGSSPYGGVQGGMINGVIRDNNIRSGGALSCYLNVNNTLIENNTLESCSGFNLSGGLMLNTYNCITWNNRIVNNKIIGSGYIAPAAGLPTRAVTIQSIFQDENSIQKQYNNSFVDNVVIGGDVIFINKQENFVMKNNSIKINSIVVNKALVS
jgi:hypothetical protein